MKYCSLFVFLAVLVLSTSIKIKEIDSQGKFDKRGIVFTNRTSFDRRIKEIVKINENKEFYIPYLKFKDIIKEKDKMIGIMSNDVNLTIEDENEELIERIKKAKESYERIKSEMIKEGRRFVKEAQIEKKEHYDMILNYYEMISNITERIAIEKRKNKEISNVIKEIENNVTLLYQKKEEATNVLRYHNETYDNITKEINHNKENIEIKEKELEQCKEEYKKVFNLTMISNSSDINDVVNDFISKNNIIIDKQIQSIDIVERIKEINSSLHNLTLDNQNKIRTREQINDKIIAQLAILNHIQHSIDDNTKQKEEFQSEIKSINETIHSLKFDMNTIHSNLKEEKLNHHLKLSTYQSKTNETLYTLLDSFYDITYSKNMKHQLKKGIEELITKTSSIGLINILEH